MLTSNNTFALPKNTSINANFLKHTKETVRINFFKFGYISEAWNSLRFVKQSFSFSITFDLLPINMHAGTCIWRYSNSA